jgi:hypothetical protein
MKFRPAMPLRFRSEAQFVEVKALAAAAGESVNEWILIQLESGGSGLVGEIVEPKKVKPKAKVK